MREPYVPSAADEARGRHVARAEPAGSDPTGSRTGGLARRVARRLALVLFGLVIALLLGEVLVRIFGHEGPVYTFRDPVIGRRYTRSWEGDVWNEEAGRVVHVRFNREGMRDRDWPEARPPDTVRIAILGDSMVAAIGIEEEKTFPRLLEAKLQVLEEAQAREVKRKTRRIEVMNWGVQGSSPALESILYEERVRRYRPQVVVGMFFTGNDFSDDWQPIGGRRQAWLRVSEGDRLEPTRLDASSPISEWLARNSRLYVWHKRMLARLDDVDRGWQPGLRIYDCGPDPELERGWRFALRVQDRLLDLVKANGGDYVNALLPGADEVYEELWQRASEEGRRRGYELVRDRSDSAACNEETTPMAEAFWLLAFDGVRTALRASGRGRRSDDPDAQLYLRGAGHLNERGHAIVAEALAPHLAAFSEWPR